MYGQLLPLRCRIVQRVNGHQFYDLAVKVHPLVQLDAESKMKDVFFALWHAREAILAVLAQVPLPVCTSSANKIVQGIDRLLPRKINEALESYSSDNQIGPGAYSIQSGASEFETVLEAELQNLSIYLVSQKGTHSTPDLIEHAEIMFSPSIREGLPPTAITDIRLAGRCLVLDNPTASVFHMLRALESVMAVYFECVTSRKIPTRMRNWGVYLKALQKHPDHSPRVVAFLDHIRDAYRNPILHPDVIVSEDDAESLLNVAGSAIRMLVLETKAVQEKARSLPLPLGPLSAIGGIIKP